MARSTKADKVRQVNAAHQLLERNMALPEAAKHLSRKFDLSPRQAYRYLEQAAQLERPVPISAPTVPITLKVSPATARRLRACAKSSGLTIGTIVSVALEAFLLTAKKHG